MPDLFAYPHTAILAAAERKSGRKGLSTHVSSGLCAYVRMDSGPDIMVTPADLAAPQQEPPAEPDYRAALHRAWHDLEYARQSLVNEAYALGIAAVGAWAQERILEVLPEASEPLRDPDTHGDAMSAADARDREARMAAEKARGGR